jgi:ribosomal-protein-alanine N-acetyltransferase
MSAVLKPAASQARPELVPMRHADLPRVMRIEKDIYPFPWTQGNFADSIQAGYRCWLYMEGESMAGYAVVMLGAGEAHLLNLSVSKDCQGRGVGRSLLGDLIQAARNEGAQTMLLEVRPSNLAGRALYGQAGFAQLGVRRAYYPAEGGREDALILGLTL